MIIVFGSINMDFSIRVSEFPKLGETLMSPTYNLNAGGKGANQSLACARGGAKTALVGKIGDDAMGTKILNNLRRNEVMTSGVGVSDFLGTGMAFVMTNMRGENQIVVAAGANGDVSATQVPDEILKPGNVVLMQMELPLAETTTLIERAKQRGAIVVLNLAPVFKIPQKTLEMVDYLIVNELEARKMAEVIGINSSQDLMVLAKTLSAKSGQTCVITLGAQGSIAMTASGSGWRVPALNIPNVVDTTGAGDCYCGTFVAAIHGKLALGSAMRRASVAASLSCANHGAQESYPYLADIEAALETFPQAQPC